MSLIGSLDDLGLGEILQIISLSRKSGVLVLRSNSGEGQILFREGLIRSASLKGGPTSLRELMSQQGLISADQCQALDEAARARKLSFGSVLVQQAVIGADEIESLRHEHAAQAVLEMFSWPSGDFSFALRETGVLNCEDLILESGINPQYLALEGARLQDEAAAGTAFQGEAVSGDLLEQELEATIVEATLDHDASIPEAELLADHSPASNDFPGNSPGAEGLGSQEPSPPVIVVDDDLQGLEWTKEALVGSFPRVHIFQRTENGVARIRQYLARAEIPLILLSGSPTSDPLLGAHDFPTLCRRLKALSPRLRVLRFDDAESEGSQGEDGFVRKPSESDLCVADAGGRQRDFARQVLAAACPSSEIGARGTDPELSARALARLKEVSGLLMEPNGGVDVLRLVLEFAAESFARVALFMIREETAIGMAQLGLPRAGGPDDGVLRQIRLPARESAWFAAALDSRAPLRGPAGSPGDEALAVFLGNTIAEEAYVAPLESGGQVVALLYADNLPENLPLADTSALEVILQQAGMALDRAVLERTLAEQEPAGSP